MKCIHCGKDAAAFCCVACQERIGQYLEVVQVYALGHRVLVVGVQRVDGWRAYCDAVPGINHDRECKEVARNGDKLPEEVARAILGTRNLTGPYCP